MNGQIFSILGICGLLVGIITGIIINTKYGGKHNPSQSGYKTSYPIGPSRANNKLERGLIATYSVSITLGYILSIVGFSLALDSLHYTAKPRQNLHHSTATKRMRQDYKDKSKFNSDN